MANVQPHVCECGECPECQLRAAKDKLARLRASNRVKATALRESSARRGRAARQVADARDEAVRTGTLPRSLEVSGVFACPDPDLLDVEVELEDEPSPKNGSNGQNGAK